MSNSLPRTGILAAASLAWSVAAAVETPSLRVIYSNFNSDQGNLYQACCGVGVVGRGNEFGKQYIAVPFIPSEDGSIRKIVVPMARWTGRNLMTITLRADESGLPGAVLKKFELTDLPALGQCCETQTLRAKGVPVAAGTQYWVAASAEGKSYLSWHMNSMEANGKFASKQADIWQETPTTLLPALEVLGD